MADVIEIRPLDSPPAATVRVPGSKSYTNRALVAAALAEGRSVLEGALFSDDTRHMRTCLDALGIPTEADEADARICVDGQGGRIPARAADLYVGNAGTVARFLPPMLALGEGEYRVDGVPRMRERPLRPLLDALDELGGEVVSEDESGALPLRIRARGLTGGRVEMPADASSQFISGLLLSGPYMRDGLDLTITTHAVSRPYLDMTLATMSDFGVVVERPDPTRFSVPHSSYRPIEYDVEPDASAASYFFAAAAITGGAVQIPGLGVDSLQGDLAFVRILEDMGCAVTLGRSSTRVEGPRDRRLRGLTVDMADLSDVAQTLAVVAAFADSPTRITGIGFIRRKETDRIAATVAELRRLGIEAESEADGILVRPGTPVAGTVRTYDDHRMAMSFALIGLRVAGVRIADPDCCAKTFPGYFDTLGAL